MYIEAITNQKPEYRTLEIRWFFTSPVEELHSFLIEKSDGENEPETRTDTYFPIAERPDLGLKIRNENYEVKQRREWEIPNPESQPLPGKFEAWDKWSLDKFPEATSEITGLAVLKKRTLVKLDKEFKVVSSSTWPPKGIQIEYTEIQIEAVTYYTFALEVSGIPTAESLLDISRNIPIHPRLTAENCCSYPAFILGLNAKK
ncbi:hypothetical protein [Cyclobacterium qasimii]|uniref:CYTH domain-containing protein n=2 Tax=Cyclobacterium qasimii TaxID=1350429 RepID=S7WT44_9BACT|nr:hypothetical protein [Cyclobacterium qasimii]EPR67258.1 hypothetical protein ADICYQ_3813 [Cyclobacterium qasimii M12-11B]GEO21598.1 hypothetical protein CQA01_21320 [Cyclobacterium qasimii]